MLSLEGRVALVTGAAQGIGRAIALALAEAGATVAGGDVNMEKMESVAKEIEALGRKALAIHLDIANADSVKPGVEKVLATFERIDILVNNAGITKDNLILRMQHEVPVLGLHAQDEVILRELSTVSGRSCREWSSSVTDGSSTSPQSWPKRATRGKRTIYPRKQE